MPPKCENKRPTIRINMHAPETTWHPHFDRTFTVKDQTEFETWAKAMRAMMVELTHSNARLMVGYWGDALNILPLDVRKVLLNVIAHGYGLKISSVANEPDTIEVSLVQRYEPLVGDQELESGLVVPKSGASDLVLPGQKEFKL